MNQKLLNMQRYFVQLSFKGTRYHGWQIQPNAISVQQVAEHAFSTLLREKVEITGAGRTDTGVHASYYVMHFNTLKVFDLNKLVYRLNRFLPYDVAVQKIWKVPAEAHARYSAISRTYHYYITIQKNPFTTETEFYFHEFPDVAKMNEAAEILLHYSDFTSFCRLHSDVKTKLCEIFDAGWIPETNRLIFHIRANRFLRNMVRAIVGTMIDVGRGKISPGDFRNIIELKNRGAAGASAPAHGLVLSHIEYPVEFRGGE